MKTFLWKLHAIWSLLEFVGCLVGGVNGQSHGKIHCHAARDKGTG